MPTDDTICVVRDHRWLTADEQAARFRDHGGCRVTISLGGGKRLKQVTRPDLEQLVRDGTVVRFVYGFLLADPRSNVTAMRSDFERALKRIEKRGGVLEDADSGLRAATAGHRRAMVALAHHMIGRHCQGKRSAANGERRKGRPLVTFTEAQLKDAKAIWRNLKDYPTWVAAAAALAEIKDKSGEEFTTARAFKLWKGRR